MRTDFDSQSDQVGDVWLCSLFITSCNGGFIYDPRTRWAIGKSMYSIEWIWFGCCPMQNHFVLLLLLYFYIRLFFSVALAFNICHVTYDLCPLPSTPDLHCYVLHLNPRVRIVNRIPGPISGKSWPRKWFNKNGQHYKIHNKRLFSMHQAKKALTTALTISKTVQIQLVL